MSITLNGAAVETAADRPTWSIARSGDARRPGVAVAVNGEVVPRRPHGPRGRRRRRRRRGRDGGAGRMSRLVIAGETLASRLFLGTGGLPQPVLLRAGARGRAARRW